MSYFLNINKNLLFFSLVILIILPIFGFKFLISFLGNILLLLLLIPILILVLIFLGFNSYKSKINICSNCGAIDLGFNEKCLKCGADLESKSQRRKSDEKPSESTIEIKAEEIK